MRLFGTARVNGLGHLEIGGCDSVDLAERYGTPLYVMDEELIRSQCRKFKTSFKAAGIETEVIYAAKAFLTVGMAGLIREEGLALDVVSGGELYTALMAHFPAAGIFMHGNNKTRAEIEMAIKAGVGRIVVDNATELSLIEQVARLLARPVSVLIRINPGIEAGAHEYIQTARSSSKFGISIASGELRKIVQQAAASSWVRFAGLHCHIGSQIARGEPFYQALDTLLSVGDKLSRELDVQVRELNLGGGFGVYYCRGDQPLDLASILARLLRFAQEKARSLGMVCPKLQIEPGRAIVANAGTTLYRVGSVKDTPGGARYVFVDGGMSDNIRTALYGARYEAALANRLAENNRVECIVSGKCCESADILVKNAALPLPRPGDLLAVSSTGAYNYSMASNYNGMLKPPVVLVKEGHSTLLVNRETYRDMLRTDTGFCLIGVKL